MVKVLYITGWGRSGSTILGNLLGQIPDFISVGEIRHLSERGLGENRPCGCGEHFRNCSFWKSVLQDSFKSQEDYYNFAQQTLRQKFMSSQYLPLLYLPGREKIFQKIWSQYLISLENLYNSIQLNSQSKLIVDSSKSPLYAYALSLVPSIDLYVVHLVRDPRSVAYSWMRKKSQPDKGKDGYLPRYNPLKSSLQWSLVNASAETLKAVSPDRFLTLRYEDFVMYPHRKITEILDFVKESEADISFLDNNSAVLNTNHTFSGNPNRLQTGLIKLKLDDEWKLKMKPLDKFLVTIQNLPQLIKYHYLEESK
ncbi:MAG TPA: sulfotransferase [Stenomitos sp.]